MNNHMILFSEENGVLLIQLLLAQIISDFVLQTATMVKNKRWLSGYMLLHIVIVLVTATLLTGLWKLASVIAVTHWFLDSVKMELEKRKVASQSFLFVADQLLHVMVIIVVWAVYLNLTDALMTALLVPVGNYRISLIILGYAIAIWPVGYLIKFATQGMAKQNISAPEDRNNEVESHNEKIEHGGRRIGHFERIIILTFVLLSQYEAIGFLITGKSIIRFAQRDENLRSEYVLVGTMMSYACSILVGVLINWLLGLT
jgi:uncharacterized protein DUF3307